MSKASPLFFVDVHSEYQAGFDFAEAKRQGYAAAIVKASQGDRFVPGGFRAFAQRALNSGLIVGFYHFLEAGPTGAAQARHFLRTVEAAGGPEGKILCVDFEHYDRGDPSNAQLKTFVSTVKRATGQPVVLYTNKGFWEGDDSSGAFNRYGADALWVARYADMERHARPRDHYHEIRGWDAAWESVGGRAADAWQFTSTGLVAGQYVDVNAWRHSLEELRDLTKKTMAVEPAPKPGSQPSGLPAWVERPLSYLENAVGGPYVPWVSGPFGMRSPAWVGPLRPAREVAREGAFCAAAITLSLKANGIPLPEPGDPSWEGGLLDYGTDYIDEQGIAVKWKLGMDIRIMDLVIVKYTGPVLDDQGHTWVVGRNGKMIQWDLAFGGNTRRTMEESVRLFSHGKKVHVIRREKWLKPKGA